MNMLAWNNNTGPCVVVVGRQHGVMKIGIVGGIRITMSEVKFLDYCTTNYCESICQGCFFKSRTKVRGSKTIRYRRSPDHKPCQLEIGECSL